MTERVLQAFSSPVQHIAASGIIRRRSGNRADLRDVALEGLNLESAREVLDLGCGFGFMASKVMKRVAANARVLGVDACEQNRSFFFKAVAQTGRQAEFRTLTLSDQIPVASHCMDLVVASYSIYFFPDLLSEVSRVLRAEGLFLAITHSEKTPRSLCEAAGLDQAASPLVAYVRKFSAENGRTLLSRFFGQVESTNYLNDLCFEPRHVEELCEYMRFKLPLLVADNPRPAELSPEIRTRLAEGVRADGRLLINKDDAVFRCREPLVR